MRCLYLGACFVLALVLQLGQGAGLANAADDEKVKANLAKLSDADRKLAEAQKMCPIEDEPLGSTGVPIKLIVKGQPVFICCAGCKEEVEKDPDKVLKKVEELKKKK